MKKFLLLLLLASGLFAQTPLYLFDSPIKGNAVSQNGSNQYEYVTPALRMTGTYALRDDFSDGNYTGWTVSSGAYAVDTLTNPLSSNRYNLKCTTAGIISVPMNQAYGRWSFDVYKGADGNSWKAYFINSVSNLTSHNAYHFYQGSGEQLGMQKYASGSGSDLWYTANSYTTHSTWYHIDIERTTAGVFSVYITGGAFTTKTLVSTVYGSGTNPVTDNTYTSSNYFVLDLDANDRISNISCEYGEGSLDLNSFERVLHSFNRGFELNNVQSEGITLGSDLLSGWDLTNWTTNGVGVTIVDNNTFTTTNATTGIYKGVLSSGKTYKIVIAGTISDGKTLTFANQLTQPTVTGTFSTTIYAIQEAGNGNLYLRMNGACTVDITSFSVQEVTAIPWASNGNHIVAVSNTDKKTGTYSLAITSSAAGNATNCDTLPSSAFTPFVAGEKYTFEGWARGTGVLGSDIVTNGSFASDYTNWSNQYSTNLTLSLVTGNGFSGNALRGEYSTGTTFGIKQNLTIALGKTYYYSFKYRSSKVIDFFFGASQTVKSNLANTGNCSTVSGYVVATGNFTSIMFFSYNGYSFGSGDYIEIDDIVVKEVTLPSITLSIGGQSKTISSISCVPSTFTKLVWNFQATLNEVNQPIKVYANQADVIYFDDFSVTQAYDGLINACIKTSSPSTPGQGIVDYTASTSDITFPRVAIFAVNGVIRIFARDGYTSAQVDGTTLINNNSWRLISFYLNRTSNELLFVDGRQDATLSLESTGKLNNNISLIIGYKSTSPSSITYFNGLIGETQATKFKDIALSNVSANSLASAYKNGLPKNWVNGLPVFGVRWKGTSLTQAGYDYSGAGNHLTFVNVTIADIIFGQGYNIK